MQPKRPRSLSQDVAEAKRRVEQWRKTREKPGRMPEDLWELAVRVAQSHGINPVAQALNLDYYSLKRRFNTASGVRRRRSTDGRRSRGKASPSPAFVAVDVTPPLTTPECILELKGPRGAKMTVRLRGAVDVVALVEAFWSRRR